MNSLKRRMRSHFWFPKMNQLIEDLVKQCMPCQMFTPKATKEPITAVKTPKHPWQDVSIDLFGPMPDKRHIVVVQDIFSRYPAARIVPSTAATPVLNAIDNIYTDYGKPDTHRTDNGPPFNSSAFKQFSESNDIAHHTIYPHHPQANPVETFMKPIGKTMKIAEFEKNNKQQALNQLLSAYRSTPHPATGVPPAELLFREDYRQNIPKVPHNSKDTIQQAYDRDISQRLNRQHQINSSHKRKVSNFAEGDLVMIKNQRSSKYVPYYGPLPYQVKAKDGLHGLILQRIKDGKIMRRHCDDVKPYPSTNLIPYNNCSNHLVDNNLWVENNIPQADPLLDQDNTYEPLPIPDQVLSNIVEEPVAIAETNVGNQLSIAESVKHRKRNVKPIEH